MPKESAESQARKQDLHAELLERYERAGNPSYRVIANASNVSHATVQRAIKGHDVLLVNLHRILNALGAEYGTIQKYGTTPKLIDTVRDDMILAELQSLRLSVAKMHVMLLALTSNEESA